MMPFQFHAHVVRKSYAFLDHETQSNWQENCSDLCWPIKNTNIKISLLMTNTPESLSSHIQTSTTFSICRAMKTFNPITLFADDCLIYKVIHSSTDHQTLQQDLTILSKWADKWQMAFNISKCKIMQISNHHNKSLFSYVMNGTSLAVTEQHLYLGVKLHHGSHI